MKYIKREYLVLLFGIIFLYLIFFILLAVSYKQNRETLVYSLDDAYIHMAMAKNFTLHGVWGVTKHEFTSCSSSILWTSLLASIYFFTGVNEITPFILNLIFGTLVIISSYLILKKYEVKPFNILLVLLMLVIVTPIPPLMFTGLEHVMHIWISLLFIYFAAEGLTGKDLSKKNLLWLIIIGGILPAIRYEGIFIIFIAAVLFFMKRKWLHGAAIFISSFIPIFIFGIISVNNSWSFFPNSLLLKGNFPDVMSLNDFIAFTGIFMDIFIPFRNIPILIAGLTAVIVIIIMFKKSRFINLFNNKITYLVILFAANVLLYFAYSKSGWSYRYQTFLVALGIIIFSILFFKYILINFRKYFLLKTFITFIYVILLMYFTVYGIDLVFKTPRSSTNIYEQQYQMGRFLNKYYQNSGAALNDVGASNFLADIRCLDLWGLSNIAISKVRRSGSFREEDIRAEAQKYHVRIAILYESWFAEGDSTIIPREWIKAGQWEISDNVIAGDSVISFYAVNYEQSETLKKNLNDYSPFLPPSVIQSGNYIKER